MYPFLLKELLGKGGVSVNKAVQADIASSWTLPSRLYTDASVTPKEWENVFARTWQIVGRSAQLSQPGDYFTTTLGDEPLLLVRGAGGELRGFYNVCRHRAGPPAQGCGSRKVFRCGYHGWTYGLDGRLLNAPEFEGLKDFDHKDFS